MKENLPRTLPNCLIILIGLSMIMGCQKISNQLPGNTIGYNQLTLSCVLNGGCISGTVMDVIFTQITNNGIDSVWVSFRNNPLGPALNNVSLVIEYCDSANQNYNNCNTQYLNLPALQAGGGIQYYRLFAINKNLHLDTANFHVGILSYQGCPAPFDGLYSSGTITFQPGITSHSTIPVTYMAKGYVFADGSALFRLINASTSNAQFNIAGNFTSTGIFNCIMKPDMNTTSNADTLSYSPAFTRSISDSLLIGSFTNLAPTQLIIPGPPDTIGTVTFNLKFSNY